MRSQSTKLNGHFDYTESGKGPPIIFLHGWPFHKETYRKVIPLFERYHTCYNLNSLGMSNNGIGCHREPMDFHDHADRVIEFANEVGLEKFSILAHDTGATIARITAANEPAKVDKLILLNTEIPFHRPPFIPLYQRLFRLPGSSIVVKALLKSKAYRNSRMGYGGCFHNNKLIDEEFFKLFVNHFISDQHRFEGLRQYLTQLDFNVIDRLDDIHSKIVAPTQYIWGKEDTIFPVKLGREMSERMNSCEQFVEVAHACFLPHEEQPEFVAKNAIAFMNI